MNNIVYSTDSNWKEKCTKCGFELSECTCKSKNNNFFSKQTAHLRREKKGRRGKTVTIVSNLKGDLKSLLRELQKSCATGGSIKISNIEIQGDFLERIKGILQEKGIKTKQVGG